MNPNVVTRYKYFFCFCFGDRQNPAGWSQVSRPQRMKAVPSRSWRRPSMTCRLRLLCCRASRRRPVKMMRKLLATPTSRPYRYQQGFWERWARRCLSRRHLWRKGLSLMCLSTEHQAACHLLFHPPPPSLQGALPARAGRDNKPAPFQLRLCLAAVCLHHHHHRRHHLHLYQAA